MAPLGHVTPATVHAVHVGTMLCVGGFKSTSHMKTQEAKSQGYCGLQYFISF